MLYNIAVAYDLLLGIGLKGQIPWALPGDLKKFKEITTQPHSNCVIMGRKTWDSLPLKVKPLKNRFNIVLSRQPRDSESYNSESLFFCSSWDAVDQLIAVFEMDYGLDQAFIIGGQAIYAEAISRYPIHRYYLTQVMATYTCDTHFPLPSFQSYELMESNMLPGSLPGSLPGAISESSPAHRFQIYQKLFLPEKITQSLNREEVQYLNLLKKVTEVGQYRSDRTQVGTLSVFDGCQLKFDLSQHFPLLTSKRVYWKGVVKELLLFLSGKTSVKVLQKDNVHIWDDYSSRTYLDSIKQFDREEGDLGKFYGFQWRHWGADYTDCHQDYTGQGLDQIVMIINLIKHEPNSRRILLTAWNPADIHEACLPPCHVMYQFSVDPLQNTLSCMMIMRSNDLFLGCPFNIASTALLTCLLAKTCDLQPGKIIITIGDAHIYINHLNQVMEQIKRDPQPFPRLEIKVKRNRLEDYTMDDLDLIGYSPMSKIKAPLAV